MRYIDMNGTGDADVLTIAQGEIPAVPEGQVLIRVAAAGVNRPDVAQRQGLYPPPADASPVLGLEVAGVVTQVGEGVDPSWQGRDVCALTNGGGYADYALAPAGQCLPLPKGFDYVKGAALPETFFTVWTNVFDRAGLQSGESFLVHGGTSGIGTTAIQLAKQFGAKVYTTAGSDEKCDFCRQLGADLAVNYREQDFVEAIRDAGDGAGVNVILDMVGGDYIPKHVKLAAEDGRIVNIAFLGGAKAEINFGLVMVKRLVLTGSTLRPRSAAVKARIAEALLEHVWPLLEIGKIAPRIAATFPLESAAEAHRLMESSHHMGKIILTLD